MVEKLIERLSKLKEKGNFRKLNYYEKKEGKYIFIDGEKYLNLSSNDYLGLSTDEELLTEFYNFERSDSNRYGFSTVSSRLLSGNSILYKELEDGISSFLGKDKTIIFNSGYHLNSGVLPAITDRKDLILSDKLNHASIVDGIRLSSAEHIRYRHFDYDYIEEYLLNNREKYENVFIVTESLFSMDGDIADLKRLADIKNRFDCFLYVDEAHSVGVYGDGKGLAYEFGVIDDVDIFVGTFGKAFSSIGGFVSTNDLFHQLIVNHSRTLIFTTALPPVVINWNNFILSKMGEFGNKRGILFGNTRIISDKIKASGLKTAGNSCIVPVIVGESVKAKALSDYLKKEGILAPAIRPPTVLEGTSRIRISVNPLISLSDIEELESKILKWVGDYEH